MDERVQAKEDAFLRELQAEFDREPPARNPLSHLPLARLMAMARGDRIPEVAGPPEPGDLEQRLGEVLVHGLLDVPREQEAAIARTVGERVLADDQVCGRAVWPELERALSEPPEVDLVGNLQQALGRKLAEGIPIRLGRESALGEKVIDACRALRRDDEWRALSAEEPYPGGWGWCGPCLFALFGFRTCTSETAKINAPKSLATGGSVGLVSPAWPRCPKDTNASEPTIPAPMIADGPWDLVGDLEDAVAAGDLGARVDGVASLGAPRGEPRRSRPPRPWAREPSPDRFP